MITDMNKLFELGARVYNNKMKIENNEDGTNVFLQTQLPSYCVVCKSIDEAEKAPKVYMEKVPLLGTIAAGKPLLSEENLDGYVNLTEPFIHPGKSYFALRVRGTSMINA